MTLEKTNIDGIAVITPSLFNDARGCFFESFNQDKLEKLLAKKIYFMQDNEVHSVYGVVRGLHFQIPPFAQAKLIRVVQGEILDVAVDIRKNSPTYGQHYSIILSANNKKQLFVPEGFAHGYSVLAEPTIVQYKVTQAYTPKSEQSIYLADKILNIDWKVYPADMIMSEKDKSALCWQDFQSPFYY